MFNSLRSYFTSDSKKPESLVVQVKEEVTELRDLLLRAKATGVNGVSADNVEAQLSDLLAKQDNFIHSIYADGSEIKDKGFEYEKVENAEQKALESVGDYANYFDSRFDELRDLHEALKEKPDETMGRLITVIQERWIEQLKDYEALQNEIPDK